MPHERSRHAHCHATMTTNMKPINVTKIDQVICDFNKVYLEEDPLSVILFEPYFQSLKCCMIVKSNLCRYMNHTNVFLTAADIFQLGVVAKNWFHNIYPFTGNEIHGVRLNWDLSDYHVISHTFFCHEFEQKMIDLINWHHYPKLNVEQIQLKLFFEMTIYHSEKEVADYMESYFWDVWKLNKRYWQRFEVYNEQIDGKYWSEIMNESKSKEFLKLFRLLDGMAVQNGAKSVLF